MTLSRRIDYAMWLSVAVVGAVPAATQSIEPAPDYSKYSQCYRIPFAGNVDFKKLQGIHVRASLNGGPAASFQVDTGSVGIVVSADEVPNIEVGAPAGSIKYSSSGVELDGVWTTATVTFPDSADGAGGIATAVVPVLAVKERKVSGKGVNAGKYTASLNPRVHMFGVGFGRGQQAHPEKDPFLNLTEMQRGTMRRGYTITRQGITLGLTAKDIGQGYVFQKLTERSVSPETAAMRPWLKDWETTQGSFSVGARQAGPGTILMDTGLTNMMLSLPSGVDEGDLPHGMSVKIDLLGGKLSYSFKVGDTDNPLTPRKVTWIKPSHGVFVNTGLRAFAAFDYLYDADGGYLALKSASGR